MLLFPLGFSPEFSTSSSLTMLCQSKLTLSEAHPAAFLPSVTRTDCKRSLGKLSTVAILQCYKFLPTRLSALRSTAPVVCAEEWDNGEEEQVELPKVKWVEIGLNITDEQKQAIARLPSKMTKRCKALMKKIICFSSQDDNLSLLLAAWVKVMKPKRADWLSVLKEMKTLESPLFLKAFEHALLEDSFEANIRDYTNLILVFAKKNRVQDAENALLAMKKKGFIPDQVTLTVLIHMYSKAGDFDQALKAFGEIKLLGLGVDKRAYGSMILACIRAGMPEKGEMLLRDMDAGETFAGKEVYKALLRAYSTVGNCDGAQRVFDAIQLAGIVPDAKICALLINAYCVASRSDDALSVLDNMRSAGIKPNDKCVALILAALQKQNNLEKAVNLLVDLESDRIAIGKEGSDVLSRWFRQLGLSDELGHVLQAISSSSTSV